ncbi:MAG: hypothetical protein KC731_40870 [Myxococcales bacterium]|nr:hypothetical protein [Myxococcales bacterium]
MSGRLSRSTRLLEGGWTALLCVASALSPAMAAGCANPCADLQDICDDCLDPNRRAACEQSVDEDTDEICEQNLENYDNACRASTTSP